jgi:hypothetical protein
MVLKEDKEDAWIALNSATVSAIVRAARTLNAKRRITSGSKSENVAGGGGLQKEIRAKPTPHPTQLRRRQKSDVTERATN